jgi:FkbH-like protein
MQSDLSQAGAKKNRKEDKERSVKVVVWDLDNTLWDGVLLEDSSVTLREDAIGVIKALDARGILQSISSKNDHDLAMAKLEELGIAEYFIYPQIGWSAKSSAISIIANSINVGIDTLAFIDDQTFERDEVTFNHPQVMCLDVGDIPSLLERAEFIPRFITDDSRNRRQMYMNDIKRNALEAEFVGPKDEFLATLGLELMLSRATVDDLQRAEELTRRTHQLNTTGYTYSYDELKTFMESDDHELWIASLEDRNGSFGKIGLCLIERSTTYWTIKLLLMSCRVMSFGVGTIMIGHVIGMARQAGVTLRAEFIRTDRNRMMFITYRLGHFNVIRDEGNVVLLENECSVMQEFPSYVSVRVDDRAFSARF